MSPRFERDDSLSRAAAIIRERICGLPEFAAARSLVVMATLGECRGRDVAGMRELGGFTEVIRRNITNSLPDKFRINYGSKLWPRTVVDTLLEFVPAMRAEVQSQLANELQAQSGGGRMGHESDACRLCRIVIVHEQAHGMGVRSKCRKLPACRLDHCCVACCKHGDPDTVVQP